MSTTKQASEALAAAAESIKSIVKLIVESRPATITKEKRHSDGPLIIMGNGPSLNQTIEEHLTTLCASTTMAVNFAANTPVFAEIKPRYYVLVDPHFFSGIDDDNLSKLMRALSAVDWTMTLIVPVKYAKRLPAEVADNHHISIATVNAIAVEGWDWLTRLTYSRGLGMPRPRNVLIPAIMAGVQMGYKDIYIVGADHSWMSTISVNERNEVVSVQPHFYKEDEKEVQRINTAYLHRPLHDVVQSFYVAFKSYHDIQHYAAGRGIHIYNATPGSYIDAFERRALPTAE